MGDVKSKWQDQVRRTQIRNAIKRTCLDKKLLEIWYSDEDPLATLCNWLYKEKQVITETESNGLRQVVSSVRKRARNEEEKEEETLPNKQQRTSELE